jgi:hypothetical protein
MDKKKRGFVATLEQGKICSIKKRKRTITKEKRRLSPPVLPNGSATRKD